MFRRISGRDSGSGQQQLSFFSNVYDLNAGKPNYQPEINGLIQRFCGRKAGKAGP